jgi:peptidoglycan hydrolase-like protein with peptidoglycan-binding domain
MGGGVVVEPQPSQPDEPGARGSEFIRWAQGALNQVMDLGLPVDGVITTGFRDAVRDFQRREKLPVDGIVGPETERALAAARRTASPQGELGLPFGAYRRQAGEAEDEISEALRRVAGGIGQAFSRAADAAGASRIIDLTTKADKRFRIRDRDPKKIWALVLHQMACCFQVKDPLKRFLSLKAHFAVLPDGRILQLHPIRSLLYASHGFNEGSVAVEFAGNFANVKGKWWQGEKYGKNKVTAAQIEAGRFLIRHLIQTMGLTTVLAHRQSSADRTNDPGPDIWFHVGQWAVDNLGMKDGGPGFKVGTGEPIPELWRTWGKVKPRPEMEMETDYESEVSRSSVAYARWIQSSLNQILGTQLVVDGIVGPKTRSAVRSFQQQRGLTVDGIVGPMTEAAMIAAGAPAPPGSTPAPQPPAPGGLRANLAAIALQEWNRWNQGAIKEDSAAMRGVLEDYWRSGAGFLPSEANWWSAVPWSAAFISWVARRVGAGNDFAYSANHTVYVAAAKANRLANNANPFKAYRTTEVAPRVGDIVCKSRANSGVTYDNVDQGPRSSHCDIVVAVEAGRLVTIGGNVSDSVSRTYVATDAGGFITAPDYYAVVKVGP